MMRRSPSPALTSPSIDVLWEGMRKPQISLSRSGIAAVDLPQSNQQLHDP